MTSITAENITTERLRGAAGTARAGQLLRQGQVVAIPTETVYGLAANALDEEAVLRIFLAKGRPRDNPLIVHISRLEQLETLALDIPEGAYRLAERFWPGPLTMVLKKSAAVPDRTSGGLDTVGVRMPAHPLARRIIDAAGVPLAAPSANLSGKPSPTTFHDVWEDMAGRIPAVVEGGDCAVGVESTVVDLTGPEPRILRPGAVTEEQIAQTLGAAATDRAVYRGLAPGEKALAPGMKYRHYAPEAPVVLLEGPPEATFRAMEAQMGRPWDGVLCFEEYLPALRQRKKRLIYSLGPSWDYSRQAQRIFALLRRFDRTNSRRILVQCPRSCGKSAGTVNRLRKSAGFSAIDCRQGRRVLGLTGRSGSGKSLLSRRLAEQGALVLDADAIYARLLQEDAPLLAALARRFPSAVTPQGVNRKALAALVFSDEEARLDLNRIAHRRVVEVMEASIQSARGLVVLDVPLLFESGADRLCDLTAAVLADREASLARIEKRDGLSAAQAEARLNSQPADAFYQARADVILENRGSLDDFYEICQRKLGDFLEEAAALSAECESSPGPENG